MINAVADIVAWKFALYGVNPRGTVALTSGGGSTVRWPAGTRVTLPTIFGHRDTGLTTCPGQYAYARLADIRSLVDARMSGYGTRILGNIEVLAVSAQTVSVRGWTIDPNDPTASVPVTVSVDGTPRPDLRGEPAAGGRGPELPRRPDRRTASRRRSPSRSAPTTSACGCSRSPTGRCRSGPAGR